MSFHGLNNHCSSHCVNMLEEESTAVTADRVKTLTTFPWSWFMQSIHPITGDGLIPPGWNGQRLYIFIFYTPACRLRHYFTLCLHLHFACNASQIMTNEHTCHQMHLFPRPLAWSMLPPLQKSINVVFVDVLCAPRTLVCVGSALSLLA